MADATALMKRCQIGVPRGPNAYDELHSILAECYGTLGAMTAELARTNEQWEKSHQTALAIQDERDKLRKDYATAAENVQKLDADNAALRDLLDQAASAMRKTLGVWGGTCAWHGDIKTALSTIDAALKGEAP